MPPNSYANANPFEAMMDLAQKIQSADNAAARETMIVELAQQILAAQSQQATLVKEKGELETRVQSFETWETEKQRYQLQELPPGVYVFALLQQHAKPDEPFHQICQQCYYRGKKSILHRDEQRNGVYHLMCHGCETRLTVGHFRPPVVEVSYDPFGSI